MYEPFRGLFRQKIIEKWLEQAKILEILCSFSFFSLSNALNISTLLSYYTYSMDDLHG
jgi:hypothetical protein